MKNTKVWLPIAALFAVGLLAGCGGGNGGGTPTPPEQPEPTAEERQMSLVTSASEGLTTAIAGLDTADPTLAQMAAVDAAISVLENALTGAVDLSPNETAAARSQLGTAKMTVATARTTYSTAQALAGRRTTQMGAIGDAQEDLSNALDALMADDPASITDVNDAITALQGAVDAAADLTAAEKMSANSDLMAAEVSAANAELDMYAAATMAEGATDEAMLAAYRGKLKAAQRLKAAAGASAADLEKANTAIGSANAKIAQLEDDIQDAKDATDLANRQKSNAAAMKVAEEINAHMVGDDPGPEFVGVTISRTSGDATIKLTQDAAAAKAKPYTASAAPTAMGFMGKTFTNSRMAGKRPVTEMGTVYTDIAEAKDQLWTTTYTGADSTSGALEIATGTLKASLLSPASLGKQVTTTAVSATFNGVAGTLTCSVDTGCVPTEDSDGNIAVTGGTLTFTPTIPTGKTIADIKAKYADPDMDYTYFGYWMKSTTLRAGTMTHDIETFNGGMGLLSGETTAGDGNASLTTVSGTATYYGAAAGVYVKKDGTGDALVVTNGNFTADAMLKATFGGDHALADRNKVSGTISDFMDGSTDLGFADLALNKASIDLTTGTGPPATVAGAFSGETDGGGTSGNWSGQFYGNANPGNDNEAGDAADLTNDFPSDVSGQFNGHFVNGHVAGAFGAEKDE